MRITCFLTDDLFAYYHIPVRFMVVNDNSMGYASVQREREHNLVAIDRETGESHTLVSWVQTPWRYVKLSTFVDRTWRSRLRKGI